MKYIILNIALTSALISCSNKVSKSSTHQNIRSFDDVVENTKIEQKKKLEEQQAIANVFPTPTAEEIAEQRKPLLNFIIPNDVAKNPNAPLTLPTDDETAKKFAGMNLSVKNMHEIRYTIASFTGIKPNAESAAIKNILAECSSLFPKRGTPDEVTGSFMSCLHKTANTYSTELIRNPQFDAQKKALFGEINFENTTDIGDATKAKTIVESILKRFWGTIDGEDVTRVLTNANAMLGTAPQKPEVEAWYIAVLHQGLTDISTIFH